MKVTIERLRARVEELERKYETQRLATLEWGRDVENLQRWSDQHLKRIMQLEINENCRQQDEDAERAYEPSCTKSLVDRVQAAIHDIEFPHSTDEARAAIGEVMSWMRENDTGHNAIRWLEMELDRASWT